MILVTGQNISFDCSRVMLPQEPGLDHHNHHQEPGLDHHFIIIRSLATMQENSKLDLDSIIAKLLLTVSPNLLW